MGTLKYWSGLLAGVALTCNAWADTPASDRLTKRLQDYRTYEASFIQYVVDKTGQRIQEMRGELRAKREDGGLRGIRPATAVAEDHHVAEFLANLSKVAR